MSSGLSISKDEMFLLGNIGLNGILMGYPKACLPIAELMLKERPKNGTSYIAMAFYHMAYGNIDKALEVIETDNNGFIVTDGRDELLSVYIHLLYLSENRYEEGLNFANEIINEQLVINKNSLKSIKNTMALIKNKIDKKSQDEVE